MRTMGVTTFKAQCLAVSDEIEREPVLVTRHGKPVAKMVPLDLADEDNPLKVFRFRGGIQIHGDIVVPASDLEDWDALK